MTLHEIQIHKDTRPGRWFCIHEDCEGQIQLEDGKYYWRIKFVIGWSRACTSVQTAKDECRQALLDHASGKPVGERVVKKKVSRKKDTRTPEQKEYHRLLREHIYCIHDDKFAHECGGKSERSHLPAPKDAGKDLPIRDEDRTTMECSNHHQYAPWGQARHKGRETFEAKYGDVRTLVMKTRQRLAKHVPAELLESVGLGL